MGKYAKATLEVEMESSPIQIVHPADQKLIASNSVILSGVEGPLGTDRQWFCGGNSLVGDERKRFREE